MKFWSLLLPSLAFVSTLMAQSYSDTKTVRSTNCLSTNMVIVVTDPGRSNYVVSSDITIGYITNALSGVAYLASNNVFTGSTNAFNTITVSNIGVGTTSPTVPLDVGGLFSTSAAGLRTVARFGANTNAVAGIEMRNISSGSAAEFRFAVSDDILASYLAFNISSSGYSNSLFGTPRNQAAYILMSGPTSRHMVLGTFRAHDIRFATTSIERMRIHANGNIGVGTTNPLSKFDVYGSASIRSNLFMEGSSITNVGVMSVSNIFASVSVSSSNGFWVDGAGITTNSGGAFSVNTNIDMNYKTISNVTIAGYVSTSNWIAGLDPMGFPDSQIDRWEQTFTDSSRTFSNVLLAASADYYWRGNKYTYTTSPSIQISTNVGTHYIYMDDNTGTLKDSMSVWNFSNMVQVATVYWANTNGFLGYELHRTSCPWAVHRLDHNADGSKYSRGFGSVAFSTTAFSMGAGQWYDEDIEYNVSATSLCRIVYHTNAAFMTWSTNSVLPFKVADGDATAILYDNLTTTQAVAKGDYVAYWLVAANSLQVPIVSIMGQRTDTTLANAIANTEFNTLNLSTYPSAEIKPLYRLIYHRANGTGNIVFDRYDDYRLPSLRTLTASIPAGIQQLVSYPNCTSLVYGASGTIATNKGLLPGANITLQDNGSNITIIAAGGTGGGGADTASTNYFRNAANLTNIENTVIVTNGVKMLIATNSDWAAFANVASNLTSALSNILWNAANLTNWPKILSSTNADWAAYANVASNLTTTTSNRFYLSGATVVAATSSTYSTTANVASNWTTALTNYASSMNGKTGWANTVVDGMLNFATNAATNVNWIAINPAATPNYIQGWIGTTWDMYMLTNSASAPSWNIRRASGTYAAPAATLASQYGAFNFRGHDGSVWAIGSAMQGVFKTLWSGTSHEAEMWFSVTPTGATANVTAMKIQSDNSVFHANMTKGYVTPVAGALIFATNGEMCVVDASGNRTQISPHNDKGELVVDSVNEFTGVREVINLTLLGRYIESTLPKDSPYKGLIYSVVTNTPTSSFAQYESNALSDSIKAVDRWNSIENERAARVLAGRKDFEDLPPVQAKPELYKKRTVTPLTQLEARREQEIAISGALEMGVVVDVQ
jgi:hypothetical protein